VGDVGIVAGVLDDAGAGEAVAAVGEGQREPGRVPFGSVTATGSGNAPVSSASQAALEAAAAQVPVVQPRRNGRFMASGRMWSEILRHDQPG
jgi:hypothetical protein